MTDTDQIFLEESRRYLLHEYLPKIAACVHSLTEEDVWWRPNAASNSIGNLMLHLAGNVREWIVGGIGGVPTHRDRQREFDARAPIPGDDLLAELTSALQEADRALAQATPDTLRERRRIQDLNLTGLELIYHVVEHFSMHTGQIMYITKLRTGEDLRFYEVVDGMARPREGM
ncbi:MAG TPA: DinB family protein [Gemmatimonadaceae bacterium]|nr:DinB family protein [Gemmatimonadaceae bacterium]